MPADILEALDAAQAAALVQKVIDPDVVELQQRISPWLAEIPRKPWTSTTYYWNTRSQYAEAMAVADGGANPVGNSTWNQLSVAIKNLQVVGGVTGYAQEVTANYIGNLREAEIEGSAISLNWAVETLLGWGNAAATANGAHPQPDGFDSLINDFTSEYANSINFGGASFDVGILDQLISSVRRNGRGQNVWNPGSKYAFFCSPTLEDRMSQLLTNQQRFNQDMGAIGQTTIAGGLVVATWRNLPFIPSAYLDPTGISMGTVTATTSYGTGNSLTDSTTYYYQVSAIGNYFGETLACTQVSQETGSHSNENNITLAFSAPTIPDGYSVIGYKVYRSTTTGAATLLGYVDGFVAVGTSPNFTVTATNQILDTGTALVPQTTGTQPTTLPTAYYGTNTGFVPLVTGGQNIYLAPRNANMMVRPFVRDSQMIDLYPTTGAPDTLPFAVVTDFALGVRATRWFARGTNVVAELAA